LLIFNPNPPPSLTDNDIYYVPPVDTVDSYRQYIETLPLTDDPEVFGMHENANIIYQAQESQKIINTILNIQPRVASGASGKSSDETVFDLAQQILDELPELLKKEEGNAELFKEDKDGLIPPLSTVVLQEMARFNKLLTVITNSLKNIQKAIKGIVLMSADLDSMYSSLLNNQVTQIFIEFLIHLPNRSPNYGRKLHIHHLSLWLLGLKIFIKESNS